MKILFVKNNFFFIRVYVVEVNIYSCDICSSILTPVNIDMFSLVNNGFQT
jgi:hypothetical protein